jgi:short-subunit dehydrogenase
MNDERFNNKVVFIIGATGGIGEIISQRLAEENAKLILFSRNSDKLDKLNKN